MGMKIKYIKTDTGKIIMFSELMQHSEFKHMTPVSAGFVSIGINKHGNPSCTCYGESVSLGLVSDPDDTDIARFQFGLID